MKDKYLIKYHIENGEFTKEELQDSGSGGCDQIGLISVMGDFFNNEPLSVIFLGAKGKDLRTGWTDEEWFEILGFLVSKLSESETLPIEKKMVATDLLNLFRDLKGVK